MSSEEERLVREAISGNQAAFSRLYGEHFDKVYRYVYFRVSVRSEAEDITQEVFLKVYRSLKDFQFRSTFKTWLYRVTVNTALNVYKRVSRQMKGREDFDTVIATYPSDSNSANEIINSEQQQENELRVKSLLECLSPEQRACIVLREIQGLSYQEMAETLKDNINTVRTRLKRARQALGAFARGGAR